jgi:hypothetical protein
MSGWHFSIMEINAGLCGARDIGTPVKKSCEVQTGSKKNTREPLAKLAKRPRREFIYSGLVHSPSQVPKIKMLRFKRLKSLREVELVDVRIFADSARSVRRI